MGWTSSEAGAEGVAAVEKVSGRGVQFSGILHITFQWKVVILYTKYPSC